MSIDSKQQGFILVAVLFFLFIMSLLTLSILNSSYLELRMSQNMVIATQQFRAAEAGLKLIEHRLATLSTSISALHKHYNYAGFQISAEFRKHKTIYCINQRLAYVYDVIVEAKQKTISTLTLKTNYVIKAKNACQHEKFKLTKTGRSSWRELNSSS
ncbi:MAG: PilX N-terminal domain-containing pilus assembly protein [Candidatus Aquirickettsiella sp.]